MATMKDVAELAGVSTATVSHVINGTKKLSSETTERVLLAISQVKYTPNTAAKSLRSGQSSTIGVLVKDIRGLPVPEIVGGIIYAGLHNKHLEMPFPEIDRPLVLAYSHGTPENTYVTYSNFESARQLTRLLISKGHERIAVIAGHPHSYPTYSSCVLLPKDYSPCIHLNQTIHAKTHQAIKPGEFFVML